MRRTGNRPRLLLRFAAASFALTACSTSDWVAYDVESQPAGARVEVNGESLGQTPCEIRLQKTGEWVGILGGWYDYSRTPTYAVKAYPPVDAQEVLYTQTVFVNPAQTSGNRGRLIFNLRLRDVAPLQTIQIR